MLGFCLRRVCEAVMLLAGALALVFVLVRLTGDPVNLILPMEAPPAQREAFREALGLNRPLPAQFASFVLGALRGDLGQSLRLRRPNAELIAQRLPATLELALGALGFALLVALPLGIAAGMRPGTPIDALARLLGLAGQTLPNFWLGMLLIVLFSVNLRWLPSFGRDSLASLVLPSLALGFAVMGQLVRLTRAAVLEVRSAEFVRTARAKGLKAPAVSLKHVLPNIAISLLSVLGVQFTYLLGGSVYIEAVFAWPGLGTLLESAVRDSDYPLVQAITLLLALFAIAGHLLTDLLYGLIDPRVRVN